MEKKGNIFIKQNTKQGSNRLDTKQNKSEIILNIHVQSSNNLPCCLLILFCELQGGCHKKQLRKSEWTKYPSHSSTSI